MATGLGLNILLFYFAESGDNYSFGLSPVLLNRGYGIWPPPNKPLPLVCGVGPWPNRLPGCAWPPPNRLPLGPYVLLLLNRLPLGYCFDSLPNRPPVYVAWGPPNRLPLAGGFPNRQPLSGVFVDPPNRLLLAPSVLLLLNRLPLGYC